MGSSKILVIGATGALGKHIANASVQQGHPTFALVRAATLNNPAKAKQVQFLRDAGITILPGELRDHASLVAAFKQVDVVISSVTESELATQSNILTAAKEAGTIKRFIPSEFGNQVDRIELDLELTKPVFEVKRKFRREVEASGIPYTFVVSVAFTSWFVAPLFQDDLTVTVPPRDGKLTVLGDGNAKASFVDDADIATFTIRAVDDPRTENKILHILPKGNVLSQNEVLTIWEKKIGHTFEKEYLSKEEVIKSTETSPYPVNFIRAIKYSILVKGDQTSFELDPSKELEATALYPDVKYTTITEYFDRFL